MKYNGSEIENLSLIELAFWNSGRETIRGTDISNIDPLVIKTNENVCIYDYDITYSELVNDFKIKRINNETLKVSFDFIDFNQGIKLKIYHSGNDSSDVYINGTIIGGKPISHGIKRQIIMERFDKIYDPIRELPSSKNRVISFVGYTIIITFLPLIIATLMVIIILDTMLFRFNKSHPKKFILED